MQREVVAAVQASNHWLDCINLLLGIHGGCVLFKDGGFRASDCGSQLSVQSCRLLDVSDHGAHVYGQMGSPLGTQGVSCSGHRCPGSKVQATTTLTNTITYLLRCCSSTTSTAYNACCHGRNCNDCCSCSPTNHSDTIAMLLSIATSQGGSKKEHTTTKG